MMLFQLLLDSGQDGASAAGFIPSGFGLLPSLIFAFVLVTLGGLGFMQLVKSMRRPELFGLSREKIKETWEEIEASPEHGLMGAKLAVIEADKLLDGVLRSMAFPGETMGERLKTAAYKYPDITKVWPAHKLRNQLVHDSTFELSVGQAKRALKDFERALKTLNVL